MTASATCRPEDAGVPELLADLRGRIRETGSLRFDEFMAAALYHPRHGYYTRGLSAGARDFQTSPQVHRSFGELVGRQVEEMHRRLGTPSGFRVIELGPGDGALAASVIPALEALGGAWEYHLVETSPALREVQDRRLAALPEAQRRRIRRSEASALASRPGPAVVLANEFFDALPVRRIRRNGDLEEVRVELDPAGELREARAPAGPDLRDWLERYGAPLSEGIEAEACPEALSWIDRIERLLGPGYAILVDYGDRAERLIGPSRPAGTVLAYHRHRSSGDLLRRVGNQDITAHVNFSALARRAAEVGLDVGPLRTQAEFLVALGVLDRFAALDALPSAVEAWRERLALKELFSPDRMGETFRVLVLAKGAALPGLTCLQRPWRSDLDRFESAT